MLRQSISSRGCNNRIEQKTERLGCSVLSRREVKQQCLRSISIVTCSSRVMRSCAHLEAQGDGYNFYLLMILITIIVLIAEVHQRPFGFGQSVKERNCLD